MDRSPSSLGFAGFLAIAVATAGLVGCGYQLGNVNTYEIEGVKSVHIPVIRNETYEPGISVMITDALIRRFHSDGRLEVKRAGEADSRLEVTLVELGRNATRSVRGDVRITSEYRVSLGAEIKYYRKDFPEPIIKETIAADTEFFVGSDLQEGERQAMGLIAERLANRIALRITEGWHTPAPKAGTDPAAR
jgi:hypothetical protein